MGAMRDAEAAEVRVWEWFYDMLPYTAASLVTTHRMNYFITPLGHLTGPNDSYDFEEGKTEWDL